MDPTIIAGAAVSIVAIGGGVYAYLQRGGNVEVDADDDGNPELVLEEAEDEGDFAVEDETAEPPEYQAAPEAVRDIESLSDVKGVGDTRADDLQKAGYHTASDLYFASDAELAEVHGIGDLTVSQIREDIGSVEGNQTGESTEESQADEDTDSDTDDTTDEESSSNEEEQESDEDSGSDSTDETAGTGNDSDESAEPAE